MVRTVTGLVESHPFENRRKRMYMCVDSRKAFVVGVYDYVALYEREGKRKRKLSEICTSNLDFMARKTLKNSKLSVLQKSRFHGKRSIEEIRSFTRIIILSRAIERQ